MKGPLRWALFAWFLALNQPIDAQEPSKFEKISDISPSKKFAMRISYDAEMYKKMFPAEKGDAAKPSTALERGIKEQYFFATIKAVEYIQLPHAVAYIVLSSRDEPSYRKDAPALTEVLKTFGYLEPKSVQEQR
jgi:hypothetical protein